MGLDWERVRAEFADDGTWRDIYILGTTIADWQCVLEALTASPLELRYTIGGEAAPLPNEAIAAFGESGLHDRELEITVGALTLKCHFFQDCDIEFDFDPRRMRGPVDLAELLTFMDLIATASKKEVVLTSENLPTSPIIRTRPGSQAEYVRAQ